MTPSTRSTRIGTAIGSVVCLLLLVGGCSSTSIEQQTVQIPGPESATEPPAGLDAEGIAAWEKWRDLELDSYRYRLNVGCECFTVNGVVEVRNDTVVTVGGKPYDSRGKSGGITGFDDLDPTIDALFTQLGEAMKHADKVDVTYDADTGVPIEIRVDWIQDAIDDEIGYSATPPQALSSS